MTSHDCHLSIPSHRLASVQGRCSISPKYLTFDSKPINFSSNLTLSSSSSAGQQVHAHLTNARFAWFSSAANPYFPIKSVDLQLCQLHRSVGKGFSLTLPGPKGKTFQFKCESELSARWFLEFNRALKLPRPISLRIPIHAAKDIKYSDHILAFKLKVSLDGNDQDQLPAEIQFSPSINGDDLINLFSEPDSSSSADHSANMLFWDQNIYSQPLPAGDSSSSSPSPSTTPKYHQPLQRRMSQIDDHSYPPASSSASTSRIPLSYSLRSKSKDDNSLSGSSSDSEQYSEARNQSDNQLSLSFTSEAFTLVEGLDEVRTSVQLDAIRSTFGFGKEEAVFGHFSGALFRTVPISGKIVISSSYLSFYGRSMFTLIKRMLIPLSDIQAVRKQPSYRPGFHALVLILKAHEEIFLEFALGSRDACYALLIGCIDDHQLQPQQIGEREDYNHFLLPITGSEPDPMRITCLTIGSRGDVQPLLALCKELKKHGHQVKIATHEEYRDWIEGHGVGFESVGGDPAELMQMCVENGTFTIAFLREGLSKFRGWLDDLLASSFKACQGSDLLIECPSAMGGIHIAEALKIPYFRAFSMLWTRTRVYPHAFVVPDKNMGGSYNFLTYTMFDQVFWRAISGQINRWRKDTLHLEPTTMELMKQHKAPFLYMFSPSIVPLPLDWPDWIRITGYWFLDQPDSSNEHPWTPPDDLVSFIKKAKSNNGKIVYVGFGSVVVTLIPMDRNPEEISDIISSAIRLAGVYAIVSKGWSDRLTGNDPSRPIIKAAYSSIDHETQDLIYHIKSLPHDWLFSQIDAAVHHGGAGSTGASLRAGLPTIVKPFFGDQFFWGDRVEALGVGCCIKELKTDLLANAIIKATTDSKQIARARKIGQSIRAETGVQDAIRYIYRDLPYARSLIKTSEIVLKADDSESNMKGYSGSPDSECLSPFQDISSANSEESWTLTSPVLAAQCRTSSSVSSNVGKDLIDLSSLTLSQDQPAATTQTAEVCNREEITIFGDSVKSDEDNSAVEVDSDSIHSLI